MEFFSYEALLFDVAADMVPLGEGEELSLWQEQQVAVTKERWREIPWDVATAMQYTGGKVKVRLLSDPFEYIFLVKTDLLPEELLKRTLLLEGIPSDCTASQQCTIYGKEGA